MSDEMKPDRLVEIDAMRGFAVMGILAMNIVAFSMPEWAYVSPSAYGGETLSDRMAWLFSFIFIDGKMRGLFSLLFGASMILIIDAAQSKGESAGRVHYSRMGWLAIFGLLHYIFIWFGDILFLYAVIGCIAFLFRAWEAERLIKWGLIIYALGFILWGLQFGGLQYLQYAAGQPGASAELLQNYKEVIESPDFNIDPAKEIATYTGGYVQIVASRMAEFVGPFALVVQSFAETLPLMMFGMAMMKNGFLSGEWNAADYNRWIKMMLLPGIVINSVLGGIVVMSGYDLITGLAMFMTWSAIPKLLMTMGYAALLMLIIRRYKDTAFIGRVAAAGRAAFTNYLGTSIVMTTIFYGYGLGLYGSISRLGLWAFVFAAWAIMLIWSKPWLARFRYGPLEWLWRSAARMQWQAMRR
jgi:uncharacterized protein